MSPRTQLFPRWALFNKGVAIMNHSNMSLGVILFQFLLTVGVAAGQSEPDMNDFRIDIDIYDDEKKPPVSSVQTIFRAGQYIELDDAEGRITVVDPGLGQITILDSKRKSFVRLEMADIEMQLNRVRSEMTPDQLRKFSSDGDPVIESGNYVSIGNDWFRYKFRPVTPLNPNMATSYGDFANWSARVNARYHNAPPFIRMQLNQMLIDQRQLPAELRRLTVVPSKSDTPGKKAEIVARLIVKESLSENDRTRVASVMKSIDEYKKTTDKEFFR